MTDTMHFTGERMIPESCDSNTFWEHVYRYKFARQFVRGRRVLDIACGEGYGSAALLAAGATSIVGIDISPEAVRHAREKYGIDARVGDAMAIDLPDASFDAIVSFETIEHVSQPGEFVKECQRILKDNGKLVVSTPNIETYNPSRSAENNPFHCSEMTLDDFTELLVSHFRNVSIFSQVVVDGPRFSLSGLLATKSTWREVRGYHRLVKSRFPNNNPELERRARVDPISEINRREGWLNRRLNPFLVRKHDIKGRVRPLYIVAVASGPIRDLRP
jgi:SAM-dependent methyltransferase